MIMLKIKCPKCGQEGELSEEHIDRQITCNACHAKGPASGALISNESVHADRAGYEGVSRNEKLLLSFGLGIPALVLVVFSIYWFEIRDTWEQEHYSEIIAQCNQVEEAILADDVWQAKKRFEDLRELVGDRDIANDTLRQQIADADDVMEPVFIRIQQIEDSRLAARRRVEQEERSQRREAARSDRDSFYNPDREPPYLANDISGHSTRSGAILALAVQFDRSYSWVERNMGSSNSLSQIHYNLNKAIFRDAGIDF